MLISKYWNLISTKQIVIICNVEQARRSVQWLSSLNQKKCFIYREKNEKGREEWRKPMKNGITCKLQVPVHHFPLYCSFELQALESMEYRKKRYVASGCLCMFTNRHCGMIHYCLKMIYNTDQFSSNLFGHYHIYLCYGMQTYINIVRKCVEIDSIKYCCNERRSVQWVQSLGNWSMRREEK